MQVVTAVQAVLGIQVLSLEARITIVAVVVGQGLQQVAQAV